MSPGARTPAYGVKLGVLVAGIVAAAVLSLATLLKVDPTLQVRVFGVAAQGARPRAAAADIRALGPALAAGLLPGDLDYPLALRPPADSKPWNGVVPQWTTLGLDAPASSQLGRARALAGRGAWAGALAAYDSVAARYPDNPDVAVERARVLGWSGRQADAGEALASLAARANDPSLALEAGRDLYWAGRMDRADDVLTAAASLPSTDAAPSSGSPSAETASSTPSPASAAHASSTAPARISAGSGSAEARSVVYRPRTRSAAALLALRDSVRRASTPSVERARRWVREHDGPQENLALARALVREHHPAASLAAYRSALRFTLPDSVRLEMASAALEADSGAAAASALAGWLRAHPDDRAARLQRARALAWAKDYPAAAEEYGRVLALGDDPAVRYELAEAQSWAGDVAGARASLAAVVQARPRDAKAYRLLGDLDRWAGHWTQAVAEYQQAKGIDPSLDGVDPALAEAREGVRRERQARLAGIPVGAGRVEGFGDSEEFRWISAQATKQWVREDGSTLALNLRTDRVDGIGPGGEEGFAAAAEASHTVAPGLRGTVSLGAAEYADRVTPTASAMLARVGHIGSASLRLVREPAVERTATLAALQAGVVSTRAEANASTVLAGITLDGSATAERLGAEEGSTGRVEVSAALTRAVTERLRLSLSAGGLTTSGPSPELEGRTLYWSPRRYLQTQIQAALRQPLTGDLSAEVRAAPGVAWVDERPGLGRRFASSGAVSTLSLGGDVRYGRGPWAAVASLDWSRAGTSGYRSTAARLYFTRAVTFR